jgi:hypothetical protein
MPVDSMVIATAIIAVPPQHARPHQFGMYDGDTLGELPISS